MAALLSMALAGAALADTPSPYYPRTTKSNQDLGAINRDLDDITSRNRNNLVKQQGNVACPAGQALTGATYKNGYTFGGTCQSITGAAPSFPAGSTTTIPASAIVPFDIRIASQDVVNTTTVTFDSSWFTWYPSYTYQLRYLVQSGTNPIAMCLQFNGDLTTNYGFQTNYSQFGSPGGDGANSGVHGVPLFSNSNGGALAFAASTAGSGRVDFEIEYGSNGKTVFVHNGRSDSKANAVGNATLSQIWGRYTGSATPTKFQVVGSKVACGGGNVTDGLGAFNGHFELWQLQQNK